MKSTAERMAAIFDGLRRAHGRFDITGQKDSGKKEGKAFTVKEPWTIEHWERHLSGDQSLGIVPINDDGMCKWGVIDVDEYPLDVDALMKRVHEHSLPLIPLETKSGGVHLCLIMKEWVSAEWMRNTLYKWAVAIGREGDELFPKQIRLANQEDVGNWLNMPYFGASRMMWKDKDIETFLTWAESCAVTQEDCDKITKLIGEAPEDPWKQAPPCLQTLTQEGVPEGGRNNYLFNMGIYFRKSGQTLENHLHEANANLPEPVPSKEVETVIASVQAQEKDYFYKRKSSRNHYQTEQKIQAESTAGLCTNVYPQR